MDEVDKDAEIGPLIENFFDFVRSGESFSFSSFAEHLPYDQLTYAILAADRLRVNWFRRALRAVVAGRNVLDAGTGDRALLAVLSAELGARRVVAVDSNRDAIDRARVVVADRRLGSRIQLISGDVREIRSRERFDVCVAELVGHIGGAEGMHEICSTISFRSMLPGGEFVPGLVQTVMAPCEIPTVPNHPLAQHVLLRYKRALLEAHKNASVQVRELLYNLPKSSLLGSPGLVEEFLVGRPVSTLEYFRGRLKIKIAGKLNGMALWTRFTSRRVRYFSTFRGSHWAPVIVHLPGEGAFVEQGDILEYTMEIEARGLPLPKYLLNLVVRRGYRRLISTTVEC